MRGRWDICKAAAFLNVLTKRSLLSETLWFLVVREKKLFKCCGRSFQTRMLRIVDIKDRKTLIHTRNRYSTIAVCP